MSVIIEWPKCKHFSLGGRELGAGHRAGKMATYSEEAQGLPAPLGRGSCPRGWSMPSSGPAAASGPKSRAAAQGGGARGLVMGIPDPRLRKLVAGKSWLLPEFWK